MFYRLLFRCLTSFCIIIAIVVFPLRVELLFGFRDVAFLPSRAIFSTTFLRCCVRGVAMCLKTVVGG